MPTNQLYHNGDCPRSFWNIVGDAWLELGGNYFEKRLKSMKYRILGWNLGVSDDPAHPMKRYTVKFPFETYSVNGHDKQVKIPECTYINDFRDEGAFGKVFDLHWLKWEIAKDDEVAEPKGSNQIADLKKYLKERTDEIELDLLAIRHTGCGESAVKGQKGKLEAYQDILNYLTK